VIGHDVEQVADVGLDNQAPVAEDNGTGVTMW